MLTRIVAIACAVVCIDLCAAAAQPAARPDGRALFEARCATCHGLDARGGEALGIERGSAAASYPDDRVRRIIRDGLPGGMPGVGSSLSAAEITALVRHLRQLQRVVPGSDGSDPPIAGDAALGRALFFGTASCAQCHMAEGRGGFLGSDLARTRLNAQAIRQAILRPEPTRRNVLTTLALQNGARITGLVRNEDNFSIQIQDERGTFHSIDKASVASRDARPLMPTDYGTRLSEDDIQNLTRYVAHLAARP